jgi:hypothetical protein
MMNKITIVTFILASIALCGSSLSAESICMKNSKKARVVNGLATIKAPRFLSLEEGDCPSGYTLLKDLDEAPAVQTGTWNLSGGTGETYAASNISFPTALDVAPASVVYVEAGQTDTTCTGSVSAPTAPAGTLCVYEGNATNLLSTFGDRYYLYSALDTTSAGSSRFGGALYGYVDSPGSAFYAWGTWAVAR